MFCALRKDAALLRAHASARALLRQCDAAL